MVGVKGKSGVYKRTKSVWNKGKKCPQTSMEKNGSWKGGRIRRGKYISIKIPTHPMSDKSGYIKEHILVMEKYLGRYLTKDERVHHINGIKDDNRIENLKLMTQGEHSSFHRKEELKHGKKLFGKD